MNTLTTPVISQTLLATVVLIGLTGPLQAELIAPSDERISIRGAIYPQPFGELLRFSPERFSTASPPTHGYNADKARATTGVSIGFETNSPRVKVIFSPGYSYNVGVFQDKKLVELAKSGKDGTLILQSEKPGEAVQFRLALPTFSNPVFKGIEIDDGAELFEKPPGRERVYVAVGDSITHGRGQDIGHQTWGWQVAEALDMEFYNLAVGGSNANAYLVEPIAELPRVDLVTILWGYNDWVNRGKTISEYADDMNAAIDRIRESHPETVIAVMRMLNTLTEESKRTGDQYSAADFRAAATQLVEARRASGDSHISVIDSDTMTNLKNDLRDPVHLSLEGAVHLADAVTPELKKLLD